MFFFAITPADVVCLSTISTRHCSPSARNAPPLDRLRHPPVQPEAGGGERREPDRRTAGREPPASPGLRRHRRHQPLFPSSSPHRSACPADLHGRPGHTSGAAGSPLRLSPPSSARIFDVDLGPAASDSARLKAQTHDPLEPVNIGPGGTFGMDPLSNKTSTTFHLRPAGTARPGPAPQEDFELQLAACRGNPLCPPTRRPYHARAHPWHPRRSRWMSWMH